jgi:putative flippase GtrA
MEKNGKVFIQLFRYFFSGGIAFVVDYAILFICKEYFGFHYLLATVLGFSVGLLITYLMSIFWVFDKRRFNNRQTEFLIFAVIGAVGLVLTYLFMKFFTDFLSVHYLVSKIFTTIIVFVWNFTAKKLFLFSIKKTDR